MCSKVAAAQRGWMLRASQMIVPLTETCSHQLFQPRKANRDRHAVSDDLDLRRRSRQQPCGIAEVTRTRTVVQ